MVNSRIKGSMAENEYKDILEQKGYLVEKVKGSTKWSKSVDFFGCYDLLALNKDEILGVQVKCNKPRDAKKKLTEHILHPSNFRKLIAIRLDNKSIEERWKIIEVK